MTTRAKISRWLERINPSSASTSLTVQAPNPTDIFFPERPLPVPAQSEPTIIELPPVRRVKSVNSLSNFLRLGRLYHPLCREAFVERVQIGYYAYERRDEWRTCALAAAYAGAFGPHSIEKPEFSHSMAVWRLSQRVGFNIREEKIVGPTGRHNNLADEMILLVDENFWTRAGVAEWLASLGY